PHSGHEQKTFVGRKNEVRKKEWSFAGLPHGLGLPRGSIPETNRASALSDHQGAPLVNQADWPGGKSQAGRSPGPAGKSASRRPGPTADPAFWSRCQVRNDKAGRPIENLDLAFASARIEPRPVGRNQDPRDVVAERRQSLLLLKRRR